MTSITRRGTLTAVASVGVVTALGMSAEADTKQAEEDILDYNPDNLSILVLSRAGHASYTVRDSGHWIINFPTFTDAYHALGYMKGFDTIRFEGRGTDDIKTWFEKRSR